MSFNPDNPEANGEPNVGSDYFMDPAEVNKLCNLSRTTQWRLEKAGRFPKREKISPNRSAPRASEMQKWFRDPANYQQPDEDVAA